MLTTMGWLLLKQKKNLIPCPGLVDHYTGPPLSRGKRRGVWRSRKNTKGACFGADLSHRFPGEGRDPGTTEHWVATRRTLTHYGLRSTEGGVFFRNSYTMPAESPL